MNWSQFIRDSALFATGYNTYQTNKKFDSLNESLNDFKSQTSAELSKLTASIQKGFSMLSLELAVQSQIFKNILTVLKEKRKTEAEELKNFGLKALRNGWIPDAIDDFIKSIEINRYDYQVYYLLSKCYFLQDDIKRQEHYLQLAFQYSSEDPMFRQYVGLDIVGQLVKENKFEEARDVIQYLEGLLNENIELTPLLMCKLYVDIFSGNVTEETLKNIEKTIENYEGEEPSRIITVIMALSNFVNEPQKTLIENKINLKKFSITKKYGTNVLTYLNNIEKILAFLNTNPDNSSILKIAPNAVIKRYFPLYNSVPKLIDRIKDFKNRISNISIDDYNKFNFVSPLIKLVEEGVLDDVKKVYKNTEDGNFNTHPFQQSFTPELDFNVGQDDIILLQCKLNNNELITLTLFKLIIIDGNKNTFNYDLLDDFINVDMDEIRIDEYPTRGKLSDTITFYLRDKLSEKILLFSSSSYYAEEYGSREKFANILDLLWSRAINNILIYRNFRSFNNHLGLLESYIDFITSFDTSQKTNPNSDSSVDIEFLDGSNSDVEFLD